MFVTMLEGTWKNKHQNKRFCQEIRQVFDTSDLGATLPFIRESRSVHVHVLPTANAWMPPTYQIRSLNKPWISFGQHFSGNVVVSAQDTDQKEWRDRRLEGTLAETDLKRDPGPFTAAAVWRSSREMVPHGPELTYLVRWRELRKILTDFPRWSSFFPGFRSDKPCKELRSSTCYMQSFFCFEGIVSLPCPCFIVYLMGWGRVGSFFLCAFGAGQATAKDAMFITWSKWSAGDALVDTFLLSRLQRVYYCFSQIWMVKQLPFRGWIHILNQSNRVYTYIIYCLIYGMYVIYGTS